MSENNISVAIDGPAGAGKSTIAKIVADRLKFSYIDTGAMYRAITYKLLRDGISLDNDLELARVLDDTVIELSGNRILLDGEDVTSKIRDNYISKNVSAIAKEKLVRDRMLVLQREIARNQSVVMDGRDIGTVVLPDAEIKIFLTANVKVRAERRFNEIEDETISLEDIEREIQLRDHIDSTREIAPLKESADSHRVDNSYKTIDESVEEILGIVKRGIDVL